MGNLQNASVWTSVGADDGTAISAGRDNPTNVTLQRGSASAPVFAGTLFSPRVWNGTIYYGPGCSGSVAIAGSGCRDAGNTVNTLSSRGCPDISTTSSVDLPPPNNPFLVGATAFFQGFHVSPGANPLSLALTDYLTVVIG